MDSSKDPSATPVNLVSPGIKQILERKEGLFRKNMMGKRVDYACRSVISPDPYLGTNEIGIPRYFATVLTYPTPVTDLNIKEMRQLVERGPKNYPGARWVEMQGRRFDLGKMPNRGRREAMAAQLLTHLKKSGQPAIVGRQLRDGDYVLMNRQVGTCLARVR
jgi:DNA-directed RNA polymerase I subunit RPA1